MKPDQLGALLFFVGLGVTVWLAAAALWASGVRPFGPVRHRAVPWTVRDVLLLAPLVVVDLWRAVSSRDMAGDDSRLESLQFFTMLCAISLPVVLLVGRRARAYQMGLHFSHFGRNLLLGAGSYLLAAPLVALTFILALQFSERTPHAIEEMIRKAPTLENFIVVGFNAICFAPFLEELLFRGILLPWLRRVLGAGPAIVLSSLIFALAHMDAWPAPIPLFILALFLGYLAHRTSSLVAPITLHAAFNGVSTVVLFVSTQYGIEM